MKCAYYAAGLLREPSTTLCTVAMFEIFDKHEAFSIRHGSLPHWYQPDVTYFVTFRTDDSVPQKLIVAWHRRREEWLRRHHIEPKNADWKALLHQTPELEHRFHSEFTQEFMQYLDRGYGACVLSETRLARIVYDALLHFDGDRYSMGDFVVMPNHVHYWFVCTAFLRSKSNATLGNDFRPERLIRCSVVRAFLAGGEF